MFMNKDPTSGVKGLDGCPVIIMMIHLVGNAMPIVPTDVKIWIEQRGIVSITIPLRILRLLRSSTLGFWLASWVRKM
jgi:hypothetical protein